NVHAWSGRQTIARAGNAILHAAATDWVNVVASIVHGDNVLRARPIVPAIVGFNHCMRADAGSAKTKVREEEIDYPVAVSTDCGALTQTVLSVGSCLGDLFGCPRIPAVAGHGDHNRYGGPVLATEARVGDVHIAKERARRGIVRPDLVFVRVERRVLLGNKDWLHPSVFIPGCRCRCVVGARDINCHKAFERLAEVLCLVRIVEPRTVRPREVTIRIWARAKCDGGVAARAQTVFVVPWQSADRTLGIRGAAWVRPDNSQAAA